MAPVPAASPPPVGTAIHAPPPARRRTVFFGALASSKSALHLELLEHAVLGVDEHGTIAFKDDVGPRVHELAALAPHSAPGTGGRPSGLSPATPVTMRDADGDAAGAAAAAASLGASYDAASARIRHTPVTATELAAERARVHGWDPASCDVVYLGHGDFLMPGMVDTHTVRLHWSRC